MTTFGLKAKSRLLSNQPRWKLASQQKGSKPVKQGILYPHEPLVGRDFLRTVVLGTAGGKAVRKSCRILVVVG
jgi:hypothetical protein